MSAYFWFVVVVVVVKILHWYRAAGAARVWSFFVTIDGEKERPVTLSNPHVGGFRSTVTTTKTSCTTISFLAPISPTNHCDQILPFDQGWHLELLSPCTLASLLFLPLGKSLIVLDPLRGHYRTLYSERVTYNYKIHKININSFFPYSTQKYVKF